MTDAHRSSAANLIYLCGPHHDAIDSQLSTHTVEFLLAAKRQHESRIDRAASYAVGEFGFDHLELVCKAIGLAQPDPDLFASVTLPVATDEKLRINHLSAPSAEKVREGLAASKFVHDFVTLMSETTPDFGSRLSARFQAEYYIGLSQDITGDDLFDLLLAAASLHAGPHDSPQLRAATLAVITYLFEICDLFDHEPTAA